MSAAGGRAGGMDWGEQVARLGRRRPDSAAFVWLDRPVTYATLARRMDSVAAALRARGVGHGDRIALLMRNRIEFMEIALGVLRIGAILVPINFRLVPAEVTFLLADSGATMLFVDEPCSAVGLEAAAGVPGLTRIVAVGDALSGTEPYDDLRDTAPPPGGFDRVPEHDAATIMYTSGTTGSPKGAVLSHLNLVMASVSALMAKGTGRDDEVMYLNLPLFHVGGFKMALSSMMCEATSVLVESGSFDAARAVDDLERHGCTDCCFVGMQWREICALPGVAGRRLSLRRVAWGTQTADVETLQLISRTFGDVPVNVSFGQTEMAGLTCRLRGEDFARKLGSVGRPVPHVEARIVDEEMRDVARGEVGEIVYRGPAVMLGYWHRADEDDKAFGGGWFHSGDLCRMDEDGFVYVVDRMTDMIVSGGENIYSAEVEAVLRTHPDVADVAVIAAPHERWGETPLAVVVATDGDQPPSLEELVAHCRTKLAAYKAPTRVEIVAELPRNASGKVVKPALRERFVTRRAATAPQR